MKSVTNLIETEFALFFTSKKMNDFFSNGGS